MTREELIEKAKKLLKGVSRQIGCNIVNFIVTFPFSYDELNPLTCQFELSH
jgi:hypothetical protein